MEKPPGRHPINRRINKAFVEIGQQRAAKWTVRQMIPEQHLPEHQQLIISQTLLPKPSPNQIPMPFATPTTWQIQLPPHFWQRCFVPRKTQGIDLRPLPNPLKLISPKGCPRYQLPRYQLHRINHAWFHVEQAAAFSTLEML